jgi:hypothetical protein
MRPHPSSDVKLSALSMDHSSHATMSLAVAMLSNDDAAAEIPGLDASLTRVRPRAEKDDIGDGAGAQQRRISTDRCRSRRGPSVDPLQRWPPSSRDPSCRLRARPFFSPFGGLLESAGGRSPHEGRGRAKDSRGYGAGATTARRRQPPGGRGRCAWPCRFKMTVWVRL